MQGMGGSVSADNPIIVSAFHQALRDQGLIVLVLVATALLAWTWMMANGGPRSLAGDPPAWVEHPARRVLRIGFGFLWVLDGVLQTQQSMPIGLPSDVVQPAAAGSPGWVVRLVDDGLRIWTRHPIPAAAATVWIQIGVGMLLLLAPRLRPSQLAGLISVGWGLLVWVFGEAFGGLLAPGANWLFGFPGAALLYVAAGALVALPEGAWNGRRLGRSVVRGVGLFLLAMAVLQAWPGRGSWQGGHGGRLASMVTSMTQTPQPQRLTSLLSSFASLDGRHGWAGNLVVVVALAATGALLLSGRRRLLLAGTLLGVGLSLAAWVLVQDLGFLGGVGTDPNSMIPWIVLLVGGYLAATRPAVALERPAAVPAPAGAVEAPVPAGAPEPAGAPVPAGAVEAPVPSGAVEAPVPAGAPAPAGAPLPASSLSTATPTGRRRVLSVAGGAGLVATAAAAGILLVGAVPMASAAVRTSTDAIVTEALNGQPVQADSPAAGFTLTDQHGHPVSLASLRGRAVALTFLDPVCTSDCPLIAQEFRQADLSLGAAASKTAFIAVVANPVYRSVAVVQAFDREEGLEHLRNWYFLTGTQAQLARAWSAYGIEVQMIGAGAMVAHSDTAFVIDPVGRLRYVEADDPGDATTTASSLATLLRQQLQTVMKTAA
jgi:cytochrome oxidase Cu insertion factor (SCO1/SenC/PrrC family)